MSRAVLSCCCLLSFLSRPAVSQQTDVRFPAEEREYHLSQPVRVSHTSETLVDNEELRFYDNFLPVSGCSQGMTFCNDTDDYPDLVVSIVRSLDDNSLLRELFNQRARTAETTSKLNPKVSILSEDSSATLPPDTFLRNNYEPQTTQTRYSPSPLLEEVLCEERIDYHYPRKAQTKHKEWRFVVNLPEEDGSSNFVQAVRVKTCLYEGEPCTACHGADTVCRQEYDFTKLLAISETGRQYVEDFTFPSGCKCYQRRRGYSLELARTEEQNVILTQERETDTPRNLGGRHRGNKLKRKNHRHQE